jgi:pimeloyl-ACP methyl ester carboxylesterase
MGKNASPKLDSTPQTSTEASFTTFIQLDGESPVPSQFRTPGTFTITRLQSLAGLPDRITKLSPVPALLVSISLKSLPSSSYNSTAEDVALTKATIGRVSSPVILVGHSYGGSVITGAGTDDRVVGLVYICALAPDADETSQTQQSNFPKTAVFSHIDVKDGRIWLLPVPGDVWERIQRMATTYRSVLEPMQEHRKSCHFPHMSGRTPTPNPLAPATDSIHQRKWNLSGCERLLSGSQRLRLFRHHRTSSAFFVLNVTEFSPGTRLAAISHTSEPPELGTIAKKK